VEIDEFRLWFLLLYGSRSPQVAPEATNV